MGKRSKKARPLQVIDAVPANPLNSVNGKIQATKVQAFMGPLPPPDLLQHYNEVLPGSAERIVALAECEANHRRECEKKALDSDIKVDKDDSAARTRGQWLAFAIVVIIGGAGFYLALHGHEITGSVFGGPAIASMAANFLGKKKEDKPKN